MKITGRILVFLFIFTSACTVNSVGFGGCAGAHCYEIKHLPANWRSSSSFNPNGEFEQTFSGPEGSIFVTMSPSNSGQTVPDLAQEYINHLPGSIAYYVRSSINLCQPIQSQWLRISQIRCLPQKR